MIKAKRSNKGVKVILYDFDSKEPIEEFKTITQAEEKLNRTGLKKFLVKREMFLDARNKKFVYLKEYS